MNFNSLQIFHIYYDTSTYDKVEKDVKVTMEGMLGVVGGTMGLLTGNIIDQILTNTLKSPPQVSPFSVELRFSTLEPSFSSPSL